jgi:alkylation response protein AidB-like acyl-CoA dehydrogenase
MREEYLTVEPAGSVAMVRSVARDFAERELRPVVMKYDEPQEFPHEAVRKLAGLGFMGAMAPEEYRGSGLSPLEFIAVIEEISRVDPSMGLTVSAHNGLCVGHILSFGSEDQKKKYLPDLCSGKSLGAWCLTEPGSGSDSGDMKTSAVKDGDCWVLNGSKAFITNGSVGSTFVVMAVTGKQNDRKQISAFIVEKGMKGFSAGKKENKLGMRSSDTAGLLFDSVRVPASNLIGNQGEGFKQAMKTLEGGRIGIAALSVGLAQGAFESSLKYVKDRRQFGKPLSDFQSIRWKLAEMSTEIEAARLMTEKAASMKMRGEDINCASAQAKLFASEVATRAANEAVQMFGGYGFIKEFPVEKFYRDVKLLTIGEGTSEVQKMIIAKNLLRQ